MEKLVIAGREFNSRLFLGTGKFNSNEIKTGNSGYFVLGAAGIA